MGALYITPRTNLKDNQYKLAATPCFYLGTITLN